MLQETILIVQNKQFHDFTVIGEGFTSTVYLIHGFAVKVKDSGITINLTEEADKMKVIEHLGFTPKVYYAEDDFIIMELIHGKLFSELIEDGFTFEETHVEKIQEIFNALRVEGIVARDLHTGNIMMTSGGKFKLIDMGCYLYTSEVKFLVSKALNEQQNFLNRMKRQETYIA